MRFNKLLSVVKQWESINEDNNNNTSKKQKSAILTRYPTHLCKFSRATFEEGCLNEWLQKYLPYEILLYIFTLLNRIELVHASRVCKHFSAVSRDPIFGWVSCFKSSFQG